MADRIFLCKAAERVHMEKSPEIKNHIDFIRRQEIWIYLYRKEILDTIQVSDS